MEFNKVVEVMNYLEAMKRNKELKDLLDMHQQVALRQVNNCCEEVIGEFENFVSDNGGEMPSNEDLYQYIFREVHSKCYLRKGVVADYKMDEINFAGSIFVVGAIKYKMYCEGYQVN